ncbi:uncharacterized protein LOC143009776 [Genypterus blacodes]|uniref:uncharacterized protein LOC143009776 n=1 Tax=Genypterus blacodes TaxID=154954 RepID=UPI003F776F78
MRVSVTLPLLLLSVCVHSAEEEHTKAVGDEIVLTPGDPKVLGTIYSIEWKHGVDLAMGWDGEFEAYRQFRDRGKLNVSTGEMTITGLEKNDSGIYTSRINHDEKIPTMLRVFNRVPKLTLTYTHFDDHYELTCNGDTTGIQDPTYNWKINGELQDHQHDRQLVIPHNPTFLTTKVVCEMENPVSQERSNSVRLNNRTIIGMMVFFTSILVVTGTIFAHRMLSGRWFYEQPSMPWTAEFWKKQPGNGGNKSHVRDAADGKAEENESMTLKE